MWALLLLTATLALFCIPLLPALMELRSKKDVLPLGITPEHTGNVRHFAERFRAAMADVEAQGAAGDVQRHAGSAPGEARLAFQGAGEAHVLVFDNTFTMPDQVNVEGDIHARDCLTTGRASRIRAILAEDRLILAWGTVLMRWGHARRIEAREHCMIMGRLSADEQILLRAGSSFHRMNAPTIVFGYTPASPWDAPEDVARPSIGTRQLYNGDLELEAGSRIHAHLVVRGKLRVGRGSWVRGSVKSHGDTELEDGVRITGSLICGGSLKIGAACCIRGPVVSEGTLDIARATEIGTPSHPSTATALVIRVAEGVIAHGTVWARHGGRVVAQAPT